MGTLWCFTDKITVLVQHINMPVRDVQRHIKGNITVFVAVKLLKFWLCQRKSQEITSVIKIYCPGTTYLCHNPQRLRYFIGYANRLVIKDSKESAMSLGFTLWAPWIYEPKFNVIHLILCLDQCADGEAKRQTHTACKTSESVHTAMLQLQL